MKPLFEENINKLVFPLQLIIFIVICYVLKLANLKRYCKVSSTLASFIYCLVENI